MQKFSADFIASIPNSFQGGGDIGSVAYPWSGPLLRFQTITHLLSFKSANNRLAAHAENHFEVVEYFSFFCTGRFQISLEVLPKNLCFCSHCHAATVTLNMAYPLRPRSQLMWPRTHT